MDSDEITYLIMFGVLEFAISSMLAYVILKCKMNNDRLKDIRSFSVGYRLFIWLSVFVVTFLIAALLIHVAYHGMF